MKSIYKYKLEVIDKQKITLPLNSQILTVQTQGDDVCMWVLIDKGQGIEEMNVIEIIGTGHLMSHDKRKYINTFQLNDGALVFHVFELYK